MSSLECMRAVMTSLADLRALVHGVGPKVQISQLHIFVPEVE